MTMRAEGHLNANQALFGGGRLARAGLMAALGGVLMLSGVGCSSNSTSGNRDGSHGGTTAGRSSASTGPATSASGGQAGISTTGQTGTGGLLASGGSTGSAGGVGPSGGSFSTSSSIGGGPGGGASAGGTRATGGATVSGGTTGGSSTTTIVGGTSGGNGGSVAGGSATAGSATGGSAAAGSTGTVPPGNPDAGVDAAIVPDSGPFGDAADRTTQADADADAGGEGDGGHILSCEEILFDNPGPPDNYPVLYRVAANTPDPLATEKAQLISIPLAGAPFDKSNTGPAAEAFLSKWEKLYGYDGSLTTTGQAYCIAPLCDVGFTQNYCGLSIRSPELAYGGTWSIFIYSQTGKVYRITSGLVHMIPMPRNVLVTQKEIISAIVGQKFTYDCGSTGLYTVEVSDTDTFIIPGPSVYVRTSPTVASALEYRLAIPVTVTAKGTSWTVYVDAIDGSYIAGVANFICS